MVNQRHFRLKQLTGKKLSLFIEILLPEIHLVLMGISMTYTRWPGYKRNRVACNHGFQSVESKFKIFGYR